MLVTVSVSAYTRKREELIGSIIIKHDDSGKVEECLYKADKSFINFDPAGVSLPDWTNFERDEIQRRIGLLFKTYQKNQFSYPESITFVV